MCWDTLMPKMKRPTPVTVVSNDGTTGVPHSFIMNVANVAPSFDVGALAALCEGEHLTRSGSRSFDPDASILAFAEAAGYRHQVTVITAIPDEQCNRH